MAPTTERRSPGLGVDVSQAVAIGEWSAPTAGWGAADILGIPIRRSSQPEAACWGAARLARGRRWAPLSG